MRTDEPFTAEEIRDVAQYFESLIDKMHKLFHKNNVDTKHFPRVVAVEHSKNILNHIIASLSDDTPDDEVAKILKFKEKLTARLADKSTLNAIYDLDSIVNTKEKTDDFIKYLSEVYDINDLRGKDITTPKTITRPEIIELKKDLEAIVADIDARLKERFNQ
ncbi:MAG: hypothetical protein ACRCX8_00125 [Sarcina sp.]